VPGPEPVARAVELVDTTVRDGNQSLWGATGLTSADMLSIAPTIDRAGFHALDFTSSTTMAVYARFHREDPWELLRLMSAAMPRTPLTFLTGGMRFISWTPCDEDVMRLAFRCVVRAGIRRFQIIDPSNDAAALRRVARMAREEGAEEIVLGVTYSISAVHTHDYFAERIAAIGGCPDADRLYLKDPGGLLTPDAVRALAPHFTASGKVAELHSHCTIGLAPLVYLEGLKAGFGVLHTACGPLGNGTSQPTVESTLRNLAAEGREHGLDPEAVAAISVHFRELAREKGLQPGAPREYDASYYRHQLAGGMVTTTQRMLAEMRRPELFEAVLEEVVRVRAEMGYPIIVTPVSQLVATQAVRNVIDPERWTTVSDETVRYFLGHYGEPAAPVDPGVAERVLSLPRAAALRDVRPLSLDGARERLGRRLSDEELLLRLTMPAEQVDAMKAAPPLAARPLPGPRTAQAPLVRLLQELERRRRITYFSLERGDERVLWRRSPQRS
jgi:oxaloacetate decarboxylase alpha subunit